MVYDPTITHWELKTLLKFDDRIYFRLNTIKLINNKYETALLPSEHEGKISHLKILFYNLHSSEEEATSFHNEAAEHLAQLALKFDNTMDVLQYIQENSPKLTRYYDSVDYSYPEDIFGETYR
jgi:hypothetical protein